MKGLTVAIAGDSTLGSFLAKKGTESDIGLYDLKRSNGAITYVVPIRYPEKIQSLVYALGMADIVVFAVNKIDKFLGEQIVAIDMIGIEHGYMILQNYLQVDDIKPLISGTVIERYELIEQDANKINEVILNRDIPQVDGPAVVPVDHCFNVKGVGTVILGCVRRGTIRRHDNVEIFPTGKNALVRSIQVHDEDVAEASFGNRVGVALKGIDASEIERGCILAPPGSLNTYSSLRLKLEINKYWKGELHQGSVVHVAAGLQIRPAKLIAVSDDGTVETGFEKPLSLSRGEQVMLLDINSKSLRLIGKAINLP